MLHLGRNGNKKRAVKICSFLISVDKILLDFDFN